MVDLRNRQKQKMSSLDKPSEQHLSENINYPLMVKFLHQWVDSSVSEIAGRIRVG